MRVLVTGVCGFVGSVVARTLLERWTGESLEIVGLDNLARDGSEGNRRAVQEAGIRFRHGDIRQASDVEAVGPVEWVIDAAALPSVLSGVDGRTSSRQVVEHNLAGTVNILEHCRAHGAGLILLSTSRVYSIRALLGLDYEVEDGAFRPAAAGPGAGPDGIAEEFSTAAPVSLYGATKLASEALALEYGDAFDFPVWIDRCGVLAGAGQFGTPGQGIFSYWINAHLRRRPLRYIGFGGTGHQVRDCLHPRDLVDLLTMQMRATRSDPRPRITNVAGGRANSMSLAQLTAWCDERFGPHPVAAELTGRTYDLPWVVLDHGRAEREWGWQPRTGIGDVLAEIADHAETHPGWLERSGVA